MLPEATRRRALAILKRPLPPAADALDEPDLPDTLPDEIAEAASLADAMESPAQLYPGQGMWNRIGLRRVAIPKLQLAPPSSKT